MCVSSMFIYRATVERNTETGVDDYGQPLPPTWGAHLTLKCRVYNDRRNFVQDGEKIMTVQNLRIAYARYSDRAGGVETDISDEDRITAIKDRRGKTVYNDTYEINEIKKYPNHFEAELRATE